MLPVPRILLVFSSVAVWGMPVAVGQTTPDPIAESLFGEGREQMAAGHLEVACDKFAASDRAAPSVGARINLGDCLKSRGKTASAWASYRAAASLARQLSDHRRVAVADRLVAELEGELDHLLIRAAGWTEITLDGEPQPAAVVGQPIPVDPGRHVVVVTSGSIERREVVEVEAGAGTVSLDLGAPVAPDQAQKSRGLGSRRIAALGVAAAGVGALVVGTGFGVSTVRTWNTAKRDHCDADLRCDPEGLELSARARRHSTISTAAFITAGVALGGAAVLWLTGAPESDSVAPWVGRSEAGVSWGGSF